MPLPTRNLDAIFLRHQTDEGKWENRCLTDWPFSVVEHWLMRNGCNKFSISTIRHLHTQLRKVGDDCDIVAPGEE